MDPAPFLRLFFAFVLSQPNFQFVRRIPDFRAGAPRTKRESSIEKFSRLREEFRWPEFLVLCKVVTLQSLHMSENLVDY